MSRWLVTAPLVAVIVGSQTDIRDLGPRASELYIFDTNFETPELVISVLFSRY